jgi:hypothetical protein
MGLRDILTGRHEVKGPAPDRLFAISTAYIALQTEHQIEPAGAAAIVFQALQTSEFEGVIKEMEEVVVATGGERLLCAVFAFKDAKGHKLYFIYNYKRGFWYPFVPASGSATSSSTQATERSTERELQLKAQMASELPIEPELERWFPLWGIPI